jgi:hypothetical protein
VARSTATRTFFTLTLVTGFCARAMTHLGDVDVARTELMCASRGRHVRIR